MPEIECQHMADDDAACKSSRQIGDDVGENGCPIEHVARDAVNAVRANLGAAGYGEQRRPFGHDMTAIVDLDHRAFDHPVSARVETGGLEIDHGEADSGRAPVRQTLGIAKRLARRDRHGAKCT